MLARSTHGSLLHPKTYQHLFGAIDYLTVVLQFICSPLALWDSVSSHEIEIGNNIVISWAVLQLISQETFATMTTTGYDFLPHVEDIFGSETAASATTASDMLRDGELDVFNASTVSTDVDLEDNGRKDVNDASTASSATVFEVREVGSNLVELWTFQEV